MISSKNVKSRYLPVCVPVMSETSPGDSKNFGIYEFTAKDSCYVKGVVADAARVTVAGEVAVVHG